MMLIGCPSLEVLAPASKAAVELHYNETLAV